MSRIHEEDINTIKQSGFNECADRVVEIIDETVNICRKVYTSRNQAFLLFVIEGYAATLRREVLDLKGKQE